MKALFYVAVMLALWSNYLVRVYSWKLILAKEGAIHWTVNALGLGPAVIAYNYFVNRLGLFAGELEGFAQEIVGTLAREGRL